MFIVPDTCISTAYMRHFAAPRGTISLPVGSIDSGSNETKLDLEFGG
jgi:hypothetical protein